MCTFFPLSFHSAPPPLENPKNSCFCPCYDSSLFPGSGLFPWLGGTERGHADKRKQLESCQQMHRAAVIPHKLSTTRWDVGRRTRAASGTLWRGTQAHRSRQWPGMCLYYKQILASTSSDNRYSWNTSDSPFTPREGITIKWPQNGLFHNLVNVIFMSRTAVRELYYKLILVFGRVTCSGYEQ